MEDWTTEILSGILIGVIIIMIKYLFSRQTEIKKRIRENELRANDKFEKVDEEIEAVKDNYKSEFASVRETIEKNNLILVNKINDNQMEVMEAIRDIGK